MNEDNASRNYHIRPKLHLCVFSLFHRVGYVSSREGSIGPFPASHVRRDGGQPNVKRQNREEVEFTQVERTSVQHHPSRLLFAMMAGRLATPTNVSFSLNSNEVSCDLCGQIHLEQGD